MCVCVCARAHFSGSSAGKESTSNAGDPSLIPGPGRSVGEGIGYTLPYSWASLMAQTVKNLPANAGDLHSIPGSGRFPREENGNPLQYSCLENPKYRGDWQATVPGVTKELDMT